MTLPYSLANPPAIFRPLGALYASLAAYRRRLYEIGFLTSHKVRVPVISVGNLTVGGNRKTPLTAYIANSLLSLGYRPAILSRGYGRRAFPLGDPVLVSEGAGPLVSPTYAGDEPYLLALTTKAAVVVAKRRVKAARLAESLGADVLILDDGFQHLGLKREVDILSLTGAQPFGNGRVIPAGPLRESLAAGAKAHLAVTSPETPPNPWNLPSFAAELMITHLFYLNSSKTLPLKEAQNRKFTAFCGLANPKSFGQSLASLGLFPGRFRAFPDHVSFGPETLQTLRQDLLDLGAEFLVTTYKDAVKLMGSDLPIIVAETSLRLTEPQRFMETLLSLLPPKGAL